MHFLVLVATRVAEDVAAALHPFWDNDADNGRQPHFVFVDDPFDPPGGEPDPETGRHGWWRNPTGKWDGWTLRPLRATGGETQCRAAEALHAFDAIALPYALLLHGTWSERGERRLAEWRAEVRRALESLDPADWVGMVDCHH